MNPILTNAEVGILTVFDGLHHIETPLKMMTLPICERASRLRIRREVTT